MTTFSKSLSGILQIAIIGFLSSTVNSVGLSQEIPPRVQPQSSIKGPNEQPLLSMAMARLTDADRNVLSSLSEYEKARMRTSTNGLVVGIVRELESPLSFSKPQSRSIDLVGLHFGGGLLLRSADRSIVWTTNIRSEGANAIRIFISKGYFPKGISIYLFNDIGETYGPYRFDGQVPDVGFWTNSISSDNVYLQVEVTGSALDSLDTMRFTIPKLAHIESSASVLSAESGCFEDVNCSYASSFSGIENLKSAAVGIRYVSGGLVKAGSGALLNNMRSDLQPFVITANHVISTSEEAQSAEFWLNYSSATCNSNTLNSNFYKLFKSTLCATNTIADFTLLLLQEEPNPDQIHLGWTTASVTNGTILHSVHYAGGKSQKYSRSEKTIYALPCEGAYDYHSTNTLGGETLEGSSGAALVNSNLQVVGVLSGSCKTPLASVVDPCDFSTFWNEWGKFARIYEDNNLSFWLASGAEAKMASVTSTLAFGSTAIGLPVDLTITVSNTSALSDGLNLKTHASITGTNSDQFSILVSPYRFTPPTQSRTYTIRFSPTSAGSKSATLEITHNASNRSTPVSVSLSGIGVTNVSVPLPPTPFAAINITSSSFYANWNAVNGATGYQLDVASDSLFANYASGYQDLDVGDFTTKSVTELNSSTMYYYRVRAYNGVGASGNSKTISVVTLGYGMPIGVPTISSFFPTSGPVGTIVTITGTNFNAIPSNSLVHFGATRGSIVSSSTTSIVVSVPAGATLVPITITDTTAGLTAYSNTPFTVTFPGGDSITASSFSSRVDFATAAYPFDVIASDLDGDGKPDLAVANYDSNCISILGNISVSGSITTNSFGSRIDLAVGSHPYSLAIGDLDGDGKPDVAVVNGSSNSISVFRNTSTAGNITFAGKVDFAAGSNPRGIAVGDLDTDGKPDIAVSNSSNGTVSIFRNTSTKGAIDPNSFAPKVDFASGSGAWGVAIRDLDGDSRPDLAVANVGTSSVSVLRNISVEGGITTSSFEAAFDLTAGLYPYGIAISDIDGDERPDLVVANGGANTISVFRNNSTSGMMTTNSFSSKVDFATGNSPYSPAIGDLNGDGKPDVVVGNSNNTVSVFRNSSSAGSITSASFSSKIDLISGSHARGIAICDLDDDGRPDLVTANGYSNSASVIRNRVGPPQSGTLNWHKNSVKLPFSHRGFETVTLGSQIYVFGGDSTGATGGSMNYVGLADRALDGSLTSWTQTGSLPDPVWIPQLIRHKTRLYILGGYGLEVASASVYQATVDTMSGEIGEWKPQNPLPTPLYGHAATLVANRIYVMGGWRETKIYYSEIGVNGDLGPWLVAGQLPDWRYTGRAFSLGNQIFLLGGYKVPLDSLYDRSVLTASVLPNATLTPWTLLSAMPRSRDFHSIIVFNNIVFVLGSSANDQLDVGHVTAGGDMLWQSMGSAPVNARGGGLAIIDSTLYYFPGNTGDVYYTDVQVLLRDTTLSLRPLLDVASSLSFPNTAVGDSSQQTLLIRAANTSSLAISSLSIALPMFQFHVSLPDTICGNDTLKLIIKFKPDSFGSFAGTLTITSDGGTAAVVLTGSSPSPELTTSTQTLNLGSVALTDTAVGPLLLHNRSTTNKLSISQVIIQYPVFYFNASLPIVVSPNDSFELNIKFNVNHFTPNGYGTHLDTLEIVSDGGTAKIALIGLSPRPNMQLSRRFIDFGENVLSDTSTTTVSVTNSSVNTLVIDSVYTFTNSFRPFIKKFSLTNKDTLKLGMQFTPTQFGSHRDSLAMLSDYGTFIQYVGLFGTSPYPAISVSPTSISFGTVRKDSTQQRVFNITNSSVNVLQIDSLYTKTKYFDVIRVLANKIIGKNDTLNVTIRFTPDSARTFVDTLCLVNNSPSSPIKVALSGNGTTTGVLSFGSEIPTTYVMYQNYPNPFNPATTIRFGVPSRSHVLLTIYNVLGQRVGELVNEELYAGYFEKPWSARVASGLYFYRLEAVSVDDPTKRFVNVKKMILLK